MTELVPILLFYLRYYIFPVVERYIDGKKVMPYITQERRDALTTTLTPKPDTPKNAGELNYAITMLLIQYYKEQGGRYQHVNDIVGACQCAALEFYRRVAVPYEDAKIKENGDVYP